MKLKILFLLLIATVFLTTEYVWADNHKNQSSAFDIMPWKVGQYAIYRIITIENDGLDNRYKVSLIGKEMIDGKEYFWQEVAIDENLERKLTFRALVPPVSGKEFSRNPEKYISRGFFPDKAVKLIIQTPDGASLEIEPKLFLSHQDVIEDTPYSMTPDALGKIDFSRMKVSVDRYDIEVPAGHFNCDHIFVNTDENREYQDEGFDLWRSPKVPFLGIVKMEFSKTMYWEKWQMKHKRAAYKNIIKYLYEKKVPGRRRPDTYIIKLVDYGPK